MVTQRLGNFRVEETQQLIAVVHQLHQNTQATEDRRVLTADHAGTVDDQFARGVAQAKDGVAIVDTRVMEIDIRRAIRARPGGDDDVLGHQFLDHAVGTHHFNGLLVGEAAGAEEQVDTVTGVVTGARGHLLGDDFLGAFQHIRERKPTRLTNSPEHRVGVELHDLAHRVTQGLGRDGTQVGAVTADLATAIDHRHLAPCLRGVHRRTFSSWAGTQYHHVVVVDSHAYSSEQARRTVGRRAKSCRGQRS